MPIPILNAFATAVFASESGALLKNHVISAYPIFNAPNHLAIMIEPSIISCDNPYGANVAAGAMINPSPNSPATPALILKRVIHKHFI